MRETKGSWWKKGKVLVAQLCPTLCDPMDCSLPGSSIHGILQARTLEWVAVPFSRGSSGTSDPSQVSCIAGRFLTIWVTRETQGKLVLGIFHFCKYLFPDIWIRDSVSEHVCATWNCSYSCIWAKEDGLPTPLLVSSTAFILLWDHKQKYKEF